MGFAEMVFGIVFISCVTGAIKEVAKKRGTRGQEEILLELRALREEVRQLRQQNNDVILSLDTTVHRIDRRVDSLEGRSLGHGEGVSFSGRSL